MEACLGDRGAVVRRGRECSCGVGGVRVMRSELTGLLNWPSGGGWWMALGARAGASALAWSGGLRVPEDDGPVGERLVCLDVGLLEAKTSWVAGQWSKRWSLSGSKRRASRRALEWEEAGGIMGGGASGLWATRRESAEAPRSRGCVLAAAPRVRHGGSRTAGQCRRTSGRWPEPRVGGLVLGELQ